MGLSSGFCRVVGGWACLSRTTICRIVLNFCRFVFCQRYIIASEFLLIINLIQSPYGLIEFC